MGIELGSYEQDKLVRLAESLAESIANDFDRGFCRILSEMDDCLSGAIDKVKGAAVNAIETADNAAFAASRPSVRFRPKLVRHNGRWWVLYGDDHVNGIVGVGDTAEDAMYNFDESWENEAADWSNSTPLTDSPFPVKAGVV